MKKWHIQEGFIIKEGDLDALLFVRDGEQILFNLDEIDDIIDALKRVKGHFSIKETKMAELTLLARWGKGKIPT